MRRMSSASRNWPRVRTRRLPARVGLHLEGAHKTSHRVDIGDPVYGAQAQAYRPVLERAQLAVGVALTLHAVHDDVAQGGGNGREHALGARGKRLARLG